MGARKRKVRHIPPIVWPESTRFLQSRRWRTRFRSFARVASAGGGQESGGRRSCRCDCQLGSCMGARASGRGHSNPPGGHKCGSGSGVRAFGVVSQARPAAARVVMTASMGSWLTAHAIASPPTRVPTRAQWSGASRRASTSVLKPHNAGRCSARAMSARPPDGFHLSAHCWLQPSDPGAGTILARLKRWPATTQS